MTIRIQGFKLRSKADEKYALSRSAIGAERSTAAFDDCFVSAPSDANHMFATAVFEWLVYRGCRWCLQAERTSPNKRSACAAALLRHGKPLQCCHLVVRL